MLSILFPCVSGGFHPTGKPVGFSPQIYNGFNDIEDDYVTNKELFINILQSNIQRAFAL